MLVWQFTNDLYDKNTPKPPIGLVIECLTWNREVSDLSRMQCLYCVLEKGSFKILASTQENITTLLIFVFLWQKYQANKHCCLLTKLFSMIVYGNWPNFPSNWYDFVTVVTLCNKQANFVMSNLLISKTLLLQSNLSFLNIHPYIVLHSELGSGKLGYGENSALSKRFSVLWAIFHLFNHPLCRRCRS